MWQRIDTPYHVVTLDADSVWVHTVTKVQSTSLDIIILMNLLPVLTDN